jgi:hypothetical protein
VGKHAFGEFQEIPPDITMLNVDKYEDEVVLVL